MPNKKALTLIELLIVVVILGTLTALTAPLTSRMLVRNSVAQTKEQVKNQLKKAQMYAMSGKAGGAWGVAVSGTNLVLFQGNSYASRNTAFDEKLGIETNTVITGLSEVVFARATGVPSATPTITITSANETDTFSINSQGVSTS